MAFFLSGLLRRSGRVNGAGAVKCRRIIYHLQVDLHRSAQRLLYLCWDGKEEMGGEVPATARPDRLPTKFANANFLLATGLLFRVTRPSAWSVPLILLPFLGARRGADLQGLGLLDW